MLCISIFEPTIQRMLEVSEPYDFVEYRLDALGNLELGGNEIYPLYQTGKKTITTFRANQFINNDMRKCHLELAVDYGSNYIDYDIGSPSEHIKALREYSRHTKTKLIISYHNFNETPDITTFNEIIKNALDEGADIVKIATFANDIRDNLRLLTLLNEHKNIVVIGMGVKGKLTRFLGPLLGAPFTFAAPNDGNKTAPGQMTKQEFEEKLCIFNEFTGNRNVR